MMQFLKLIGLAILFFFMITYVLTILVKDAKSCKKEAEDFVNIFSGIKGIKNRTKNVKPNIAKDNNVSISVNENTDRRMMEQELIETYKQDEKTIKKLNDEEIHNLYLFWTN